MGYSTPSDCPTGYPEADKILSRPIIRAKQRKKVANNTYLERRDEDTVALRYHDTDVVTFHEDGSIVLNSGGWRTVTTKERINWCLPDHLSISQENGVWIVYDRRNDPTGGWWNDSCKVGVFRDGMSIDPAGSPQGMGGYTAVQEKLSETKRLKRRLKKFAKDFIQALIDGNVPPPGPGDCFICQFAQSDRKMDQAGSHLDSHLEEKYYVPRMLHNAIQRYPVSMAASQFLAAHWADNREDPENVETVARMRSGKNFFSSIGADQLYSSLYRYLCSCYELDARGSSRGVKFHWPSQEVATEAA